MGVPACHWYQMGEIYIGNGEFSELAGVDGYIMRDVSCLVVTMNACKDLFLLYRAASGSMSLWQKGQQSIIGR
jgi:hypothetical protein